MATLNRCPIATDICLTRGDTQAFGFTILDANGSASDISNNSYLFTVNSLENPPDDTTQIFQTNGVIESNTVSINLSSVEADQLGLFYFDLQETDGSLQIFTLTKGPIEWNEDITKA